MQFTSHFPYVDFIIRLSLLAVPFQSENSYFRQLVAAKLAKLGNLGVSFRTNEN